MMRECAKNFGNAIAPGQAQVQTLRPLRKLAWGCCTKRRHLWVEGERFIADCADCALLCVGATGSGGGGGSATLATLGGNY